MKHNRITIVGVSILVMSLLFYCKKNDDDSNTALLLGATAVAVAEAEVAAQKSAAEAAGGFSDVPQECDRTNLDCLKSLIVGKKWYSVGNTQIPRNFWGIKYEYVNFYCFTKFIYEINEINNVLSLSITDYRKNLNIESQTCGDQEISSSTITSVTITPVSKFCFNIDIGTNIFGYQGRGWVKGDGTELRLELYQYLPNGISQNNIPPITPAGHRCGDGPVGSKNQSLTPDSEGCISDGFVCSPASDPNYNNILIFDLTE